MKIHTLKFALAAGITLGLAYALTTILALAKVPGYVEASGLLLSFYGAWGYSISTAGVISGLILGFLEGFVWAGIMVFLYNKFHDMIK